MAYLSKIPLNPLRKGTQSLLRNPQRLHAAVMGSVPAQSSAGRFLWRLEQREHCIELFVLSPAKPSWDHLVEQAGWSGADGGEAQIKEYEPLMQLLMVNRQFAFRLKANPIQNLPTVNGLVGESSDSTRSRGKRLGHRTAAHQLNWFLSRCTDGSQRWGFTAGSFEQPSVALVARQTLRFTKGNGQTAITLNTATFEGRLTVTDVGLLRRSLLDGIGSGKAYGCGLLTLASL